MRFVVEKGVVNVPLNEVLLTCGLNDASLDLSEADFPKIELVKIEETHSLKNICEECGIKWYKKLRWK